MTPIPPVPRPEEPHSGARRRRGSFGNLFTDRPGGENSGSSSQRFAALASLLAVMVGLAVLVPATSGGPSPSTGPGGCTSYKPLAPVGSGVVRSVSNQSELASALSAANPGDTINLASGRYDQVHYRQSYGHTSGLESRPIVIQAAAGAKAIVGGSSIDPMNWKPAVDVVRSAHVMIRGLDIGNAMFGARSSASHHITFEYNRLSNVGHSGIITQAFWNDETNVSSHTTIRCNRISRTGQIESEYGEGIYIGTGTFSKTDSTHDVLVEYNELFDLSNEAVDVKHNTTNVVIRHNSIHDVTPNYGGAISLGLNRTDWGPANYLVEENQIWNVSNGMHYAQAIAVAHGPTEIRNNTIWNIEVDPQSTWPGKHVIQVHGDDNPADWASAFGSATNNQVTVAGNTIHGCEGSCISSYADTGAISPQVSVRDNIVTAASAGLLTVAGETLVGEADFVGPTIGPADSGSGPGSGLALRSDEPTTSTTQDPVETTTSTTTQSETTETPVAPDADNNNDDISNDDTAEREDGTTPSTTTQEPTTQKPTTQAPTTQAAETRDPTQTVPIGEAPISTVRSESTNTTTNPTPGGDSGPTTTEPETAADNPSTTASVSGDSSSNTDAVPGDGDTESTPSVGESTSTPEDAVDETGGEDVDERPGRRLGQRRGVERRRGTPPRTTTTQPAQQRSFGHDGWWPAIAGTVSE